MTKRVLIVDDEENIVISLEFLMQQAGYTVEIARTGEEALKQIVMVTAKGRAAEVQRGWALGADAYITKPFSTKELLGEVQRHLAESSG